MANMNAIGWFDIYVSDMKRAVSFYEAVFNIKLEKMIDPSGETEMMAFPTEMSAYGAGGALSKSKYGRPGQGGTVIYFNSENCAQEESRIIKAGGKVLRPKFSIGQYGWVTLCEDTEGNLFGISSQK